MQSVGLSKRMAARAPRTDNARARELAAARRARARCRPPRRDAPPGCCRDRRSTRLPPTRGCVLSMNRRLEQRPGGWIGRASSRGRSLREASSRSKQQHPSIQARSSRKLKARAFFISDSPLPKTPICFAQHCSDLIALHSQRPTPHSSTHKTFFVRFNHAVDVEQQDLPPFGARWLQPPCCGGSRGLDGLQGQDQDRHQRCVERGLAMRTAAARIGG